MGQLPDCRQTAHNPGAGLFWGRSWDNFRVARDSGLNSPNTSDLTGSSLRCGVVVSIAGEAYDARIRRPIEHPREMRRSSRMAAKKVLKFLAVLAIFTFNALPVLAASCESLVSIKLPNMTITSANTVAAGTFTQPTPGSAVAVSQFLALPAFCRVAATLRPSSDSDIKVEVWLPVSAWNWKFQAVGNGGFAGVISYPALAAGVTAGYASASTDTGHQGNTAAFAIGHPEK